MLLLIDNYDSFVFNLARYVAELGVEARVVRNDAVSVDDVARMKPDAVILSPGPCTPREAGICVELVRRLSESIPMLGVCLGHQCIGAAFGAGIVRAPEPVHGRTSLVHHDGTGLFAGLPDPLRATRYHSLIIEETSLPAELAVTARTVDGLVMAIQHAERPLAGVQFHPESILTSSGHVLLANFLHRSGVATTAACPGDALTSEGVALPLWQPPDTGSVFPLPGEPSTSPPLHW